MPHNCWTKFGSSGHNAKGYRLGYCNDAKKHPSLRLSSFNFAISMFQLVDIGFNGLILPNSTSWHVIFAKLKLLENTKSSFAIP